MSKKPRAKKKEGFAAASPSRIPGLEPGPRAACSEPSHWRSRVCDLLARERGWGICSCAGLVIIGVLQLTIAANAHAQTLDPTPTRRAISIDFCADQYLVALAADHQIVGLSPDHNSAYSPLHLSDQIFPTIRSDAESLLAHQPDLVIRQWGGDTRMLGLLARHDIEIVQLGYADDFTGILDNLRLVAAALGTDAGLLTEQIERQLDTLAQQHTSRPRLNALYVTPGGVTAGRGTLIDAIFTAAGLNNLAAQAGLFGWPALPAEALVINPPDLIVTGFFDGPLERSNSWSAARHPVFERLFKTIATIDLPTDSISCAGPNSIAAASHLQNALINLQQHSVP